jgi:divalent metal cation (Fe/Co/Zn/Cd) transporter
MEPERRPEESVGSVPGHLSVIEGHNCCERIEATVESRLSKTSVSTHLEPVQDE